MGDDEYDEVDAVVRIPKGERLADSKRSDGWSRGFTPKTSDKGPEHVEIRLKNESELDEPEVVYVTEYVEDRQVQLTPGQQVVADLMQQVIEGLIEVAKPVFARWWDTQVAPAMAAKRENFVQRRRARKDEKQARRAAARSTALEVGMPAESETPSHELTTADGPKVRMTSEQFQQLFMTWLAREDAQQVLWDLIVNADVTEGDAATLEWQHALRELSPEQRTELVLEFFAANPSILESFAQQFMGGLTLGIGEPVVKLEPRSERRT